jgi:MFS transporter, SHS family, lactate transporter
MASISHAAPTPADQRNAVMAGFLGWTLDAFDFFILVMIVPAVARDFHKSVPAIAPYGQPGLVRGEVRSRSPRSSVRG